MPDLPLNALKAFSAVYRTGGVRPAARELGVAHSSVSRHLRELEHWMGVALLEDAGRRIAFTTRGDALGKAANQSFDALAKAIKTIRETPRRNTVVVTTTPSFAALWLLPRLPAFQQAYPGVELSVMAEQRLIDPGQQDADLAIRMGKGPWPGLDCEPLMNDTLYPVMSREYWEHFGRPNKPEMLKQMQLLHDRDPNASWDAWLSEFGPFDIDTQSGPRFASSDLILRAAAQGLGVALARARLAANDVASGLLRRPFGNREIVLPDAYWIVRSTTSKDRVASSSVIAWLKTEAKSFSVTVKV